MKALLTPFLFIAFGISMSAQNSENKDKGHYHKSPIVIINNAIIGNSSVLKLVSEETILSLEILKEGQLSTTKLYTRESEKRGIIKIKADIKIDIKTQRDLNIFFGLKENNDIYVNKYLIDKDYAIAAESIKIIEVMIADGIVLRTSSLNIEI